MRRNPLLLIAVLLALRLCCQDDHLVLPVFPAAWNNESAIILEVKKEFQAVAGYMDEVIVKEKQKRKILLRDKAALEAFSEIYIPMSEYDNSSFNIFASAASTKFSAAVYKKNGQKIELKTSEAIPMQVSSSRNIFWGSYTYMKKLAVPNLETGDVIEYEYSTRSGGRPQVISRIDIAEKYPVLKLSVEFDIPYYYHFAQVSINSSSSLTGPQREKLQPRTLSLYLDSVPKWTEELWSYEAQTFPAIRYLVSYDPSFRLEDPATYKKEVQKQLAGYLFSSGNYKANKHYVKEISQWLKKNQQPGEGSLSVAKKAWYYFRYLVLRDAAAGTLNDLRNGHPEQISDELFCTILLQVLNEFKVPSRLVCFVPRDKGNLDHALSPWEYNLAVKAGEGEYIVLFNFTSNTLHTDVPSNCDGTAAYAFTANKNWSRAKFHWILSINPTFVVLPSLVYIVENGIRSSKRKFDLDKISIPPSHPREHTVHSTYQLNLSPLPSGDSLLTIRKTAKTGNFKNENNFRLLDMESNLSEDEKQLGLTSVKKEESLAATKYHAAEAAARIKKRLEYLSTELSADDIPVVRYDDYVVNSSGRFENNPALSFEERFVLTGLYNRPAENTFVLNAGLIIGAQVTLKEEDMERTNDAFFPNPRTIKNTITLTLPEGFKAANLEDFRFDVKNVTGSFVSSATQMENVVTIETTKIYNSSVVKKDNWKDMTAWLDAAYHFTQKKMIFIKE